MAASGESAANLGRETRPLRSGLIDFAKSEWDDVGIVPYIYNIYSYDTTAAGVLQEGNEWLFAYNGKSIGEMSPD